MKVNTNMSDVSNLLLTQRFDVEYGMIDFNDGEATRMGLQKGDCYGDGSRMGEDRVRELVKQFKDKSLTADEKALNKLKVSGRQILYKQLQEAYAFGLACFSHIYHREHLSAILGEYDLHDQSRNLKSKGRYNKWNAITALLYGDWETDADGNKAYKRDRSAEKYATVFAMLEAKKVKVSEVVDYITNRSITLKSTGKKLKGIIALETEYRMLKAENDPKGTSPKSAKQVAARQKIIARGESSDNDDVFEVDKPEKLSDAVEYGQAFFKVVDDKLVIVGFKAREQADYERHVFSRGKKLIDDEEAVKKQQDALAASMSASANEINSALVSNLMENDPALAKQLKDSGVSMDDVSAKLVDTLKGMLAASTETEAV